MDFFQRRVVGRQCLIDGLSYRRGRKRVDGDALEGWVPLLCMP